MKFGPLVSMLIVDSQLGFCGGLQVCRTNASPYVLVDPGSRPLDLGIAAHHGCLSILSMEEIVHQLGYIKPCK